MKTIAETCSDFRNSRIDRETFWSDMAAHHMALRQYHDLLDGSELSGIEIDANELRVVTQAGLKFHWRPEDLRSATSISLNYKSYESHESAFLLKAASMSGIIFDIGANIGWYSVHFAHLLKTNGGSRVHSFEPVPNTFGQLSRNIALNALEDVATINNCGLGDRPGTLSMFLPRFHGSAAASLKNLHPEDDNIEVSVEINTLDNYCATNSISNIDMIKCDVEGAELFVIRGGFESIRKFKPLIFVELLRKWAKPFGYHPNDVFSLLGELGYAAHAFDNGKLQPISSITDETPQTNFVFAIPNRHREYISPAS